MGLEWKHGPTWPPCASYERERDRPMASGKGLGFPPIKQHFLRLAHWTWPGFTSKMTWRTRQQQSLSVFVSVCVWHVSLLSVVSTHWSLSACLSVYLYLSVNGVCVQICSMKQHGTINETMFGKHFLPMLCRWETGEKPSSGPCVCSLC